MGKVDQAALVGGISIGAFTIIFLGFVYCCIVRRYRSTGRRSAHGKYDIELGRPRSSNSRRRRQVFSYGRRGGGSDDLETATEDPLPRQYRLPQTLRRECRIEVPQPIYAPALTGLEPKPVPYSATVGSRDDGSRNASDRFTPSPFAPADGGGGGGGGALATAAAGAGGAGGHGGSSGGQGMGVQGGSVSRGRYSG